MTESRPLRVGIIVDSLRPHAWAARAIDQIRESGDAEIAVVITARRTREGGAIPILARVYRAVDARLFHRSSSAFKRVDASRLLDGVTLLDLTEIDKVRDLGLDVVISLAGDIGGEGLAKHGVWWLRHGVAGTHLPGFSEFVAQQAVTEAAVETRREGRSVVIERTRMSTDPISFRRGSDRLYWQSAPLAARALSRLRNGTLLAPSRDPVFRPGERVAAIARVFPRALHRLTTQAFRDRLTREQWFVAFAFNAYAPGDDAFGRFHKILPPRDRLWADPFVVSHGDKVWIFVEEMLYATRRGTIGVIEARRDGSWSPPRTVLERPYHLSYPCVFSWRGEWFMVPESAENSTVDLYRSTDFPWRWELDTTLFDFPAADTSLFEANGRWWALLSTPTFGRNFEELSAWWAESPRGPWHPHRRNPLLSDAIGGRPAGKPFTHAGRMYRAAQNGSRRYGYAMDVREVIRLTPDEWEERVVAEILPDWHPQMLGTHTLNTDGNVTVIDGLRRRLGIKKRGKAKGER